MKKILIAGGGTGGHVFPAIAIANAIKKNYPNVQFLFVGANGKLEMQKVPEAGYKIEGLNIAGFPRKKDITFPFKMFSSLFKLFIALIKSYFILQKFKPDVCVGVGGYASGPVLKIAQLKKIPYVLQEANSYPGITNKLLAKGAKKICVPFERMERYFPKEKIVITGNPIRSNISNLQISKEAAAKVFNFSSHKKTIFITGGSLGAKAINIAINQKLELLINAEVQVIWQTGKLYLNQYKHLSTNNILVTDFIINMSAAYAIADVIISRAGGTIAELCLIGKPAILLPSPNVAEDHQTKNVESLVEKDAAVLMKDVEANENLVPTILELLNDTARQQTLSANIKSLAKPNAAKDIADIVMGL